MSSSCRRAAPLALAVGAACSAGTVATVHAAQTYVEPEISLRAETNSNLALDPNGSSDGTDEGYIADMQVLLGYASPRGETSIRPRVRFQNYPDQEDREQVEGFFNWLTRYEWQRSQLDFVAKYSLEDSYNYDTRSGEFDPLDPNYGTTAGSGESLIGETETKVEIRPRYTYELTERVSLGVGGDYQTKDYDADTGPARQVDYDLTRVNGDVRWALDERSSIGIGGFFSQYDPKSGDGDSDTYGAGLVYGHRWSELMAVEAILGYQTNDPKDSDPAQAQQKSSSLAGSIAAFGEGEVSEWQFFFSQRYAPNAYGNMRQLNQVRFQYDRKFTPRLTFRSAARYESQGQISNASDGDGGDEDTARLDLSLRWLLSRTWFVHGGYAYIWQQEGNEDDADNNRFFVGVGYRGRDRER